MRRTVSIALALLGALGAAIQSGMLLARGQAICFNEGCRIVEGLTRVSPLYINLAGLGFFLAVAAVAVLVVIGRRRRDRAQAGGG